MSEVLAVEVEKTRLLAALSAFLPDATPTQRAALAQLFDETAPDELLRVLSRIDQSGADYGYQPPDPFACRLHPIVAEVVLAEGSTLQHAERLQRVSGRALILLANHLSYSDANLLQSMLRRGGLTDLAGRLTVIAGPKVYSDPMRRLLSLCFGTIGTAQSSSRASGEAVMSAREVAAIAKRTIALAFERLDAGDALLLFPEGARARDVRMQPLLAAVARYFERPDTLLCPVGISGSEHMIAVGESQLHRTPVRVCVGEPIEAAALRARWDGKRPAMVRALGCAIAELLPESYRGVYAAPGM